MMLLVLCDAGASGVTWPKEACCISFQLPLPKKNSDAIYYIYNIVCIMQHSYWFLWYLVTPTPMESYDAKANGNHVMCHLIMIVLT